MILITNLINFLMEIIFKIMIKKILFLILNYSHFNKIKINNKIILIQMIIVIFLKFYILKRNQSNELLIIKSNYRNLI